MADDITAEQDALIRSIRRANNHYQVPGRHILMRPNIIWPFQVLGVENDATEDDVRRKYRRLALRLHPDKVSSPQLFITTLYSA